jgi:alkanesulfonate monooxygenase SsuD/methylene tetrahydromethanopterin reductase-like flavin-dependent oxidoreductase (luciferase family)
MSTKPLIEMYYGMDFDRALRRTQEVIEIIDMMADSGVVERRRGVRFRAVPLRALGTRGVHPRLQGSYWPMKHGVDRSVRRRLAPVIDPDRPVRASLTHLRETESRRGRDPDAVSPSQIVPTVVGPDAEAAEQFVRRYIAGEMAMGYADQMDAFGFGELARTAASHWTSGDRTEAMASLTDAMVDELAIYGT